MARLVVQEDSFRRQWAKTFWLKNGDLNTRFFHASATARSKVNRIKSLQDDGGMITNDPAQIKSIAKNYFADLFMHRQGSYGSVLDALSPCISTEDNETRPFVRLEFFEVFNQMNDDKSLGPDGFNPEFFKFY